MRKSINFHLNFYVLGITLHPYDESKFSLLLTKHHAMETYWGGEV
jgi:hypothetical protein